MRHLNSVKDLGLALGLDLSSGLEDPYLVGASKTTVSDSDFTVAPENGTIVVHWDSSADRAYLSVRANGTWHVMAGPIA